MAWLQFWRILEAHNCCLASWFWFPYDCWSLIHLCFKFCISILVLQVQRTSMSFKSWFGAEGSWLGFGIFILNLLWSLVFDTPMFRISALSWFWRCKEHPCPLSPDSGLWRTLVVSDQGLASWSWFGYGQKSLIYPSSKFGLSILILNVQRTTMSFKSKFGALNDAGGS